MRTECPKCVGYFSKNYEFCEFHQKEFDQWDSDVYQPNEKCDCGCSKWKNGTLQMTNPPSYPEMKVYRCIDCEKVRIEESKTRVRIMRRNHD